MRYLNSVFIVAIISSAYANDFEICEPYYSEIENSQLTVDYCLSELEDLGRGALNATGCMKVIEFNESAEFHAAYDRAERMMDEAGGEATWGSIKAANSNCKDEIDVWILASEMGALDELMYYINNP